MQDNATAVGVYTGQPGYTPVGVYNYGSLTMRNNTSITGYKNAVYWNAPTLEDSAYIEDATP